MILLSHAKPERDLYYGEEALARLRKLDEVRLNESGRPLAGTELAAAARGCRIMVGDSKATADRAFFAAVPELAAYVHGHVDLSRIDVAAASANGILVTHASAGFGAAVAELVVALMIDLARGLTASASRYRAGQELQPYVGRQLSGSTIGIIGYGHIGRRLAGIAVAIGMRVIVADPYQEVPAGRAVEQVTLPALLAEADFVVPLAVATPETRNLINAEALARMKRTAFLVNVSRGDLVDETALEHALDQGIIAGAALDVGMAPFQMPSPRLAARQDVIATPHVGGLTPESLNHQAFETVTQVAVILSGTIPPGAANAAHAKRLKIGASA